MRSQPAATAAGAASASDGYPAYRSAAAGLIQEITKAIVRRSIAPSYTFRPPGEIHPPTMLSRRSILKFGFAGAVVLAVGGVGLALRPTVRRSPSGWLSELDEVEYSILWAVAERICPANGAFPAASSLGVAEKIDALLATMDPGTVADTRQVLRLLENALGGLLLDGRFTTFTGSSPEAQSQVLEAMRTSRFELRRTMFKALAGLVGATYYAQPEVWPAVGYPGPPDELRRPR